MKNSRVLLFTLIIASGIAVSGCQTVRDAYNGGAFLLNKAKEALGKNPRTAEDEKAIADAAKLCKELAEKLKSSGYTEADIENQSPEDREKIRLCREILGAMWDEFEAADPATFGAILGALSASERSLVVAYGKGDMEGFTLGMKVLREIGNGSEERVYVAIELLTELSLSLDGRLSDAEKFEVSSAGKVSTALHGGF